MISPVPNWLDPSPWLDLVERADRDMVRRALASEDPGIREFAILLSAAAGEDIESLARRAQALTRRHFGRTVALYAPLYLSNYCPSKCTYCGFASDRRIQRHKLTMAELESEAAAMKQLGVEEILLLTGDRTGSADHGFVCDCVARTAAHFHNITAEVFAMTAEEYSGLAKAGCTAVTLYQETYDPARYEALHLAGPKRDFAWRLEAPARALSAGMRAVGLGALLGLNRPVPDLLSLFRHATYLRQRYWRSGVSLLIPARQAAIGRVLSRLPGKREAARAGYLRVPHCDARRPAGAFHAREPALSRRHGGGRDLEDERGQPHHRGRIRGEHGALLRAIRDRR